MGWLHQGSCWKGLTQPDLLQTTLCLAPSKRASPYFSSVVRICFYSENHASTKGERWLSGTPPFSVFTQGLPNTDILHRNCMSTSPHYKHQTIQVRLTSAAFRQGLFRYTQFFQLNRAHDLTFKCIFF